MFPPQKKIQTKTNKQNQIEKNISIYEKKVVLLIQHPLTVSLHPECHCSRSCAGQQKPSREIPSVKRKTAYGYVFESWKLIIIYNTFLKKRS